MSVVRNTGGLMPKVVARAWTNEFAAEIDSFMTSRRLPVTVILPLPGTLTASMVRMSPPVSVQASPLTMPIWSSWSATP